MVSKRQHSVVVGTPSLQTDEAGGGVDSTSATVDIEFSWRRDWERLGSEERKNQIERPAGIKEGEGYLVALIRTSKSLRDTLFEKKKRDSCMEDGSYLVESRFARMFPHQDKALLDLIPHTDVGGWSHGHASSSRFFWKEDIQNMIRQWDEPKSKTRSAKGKQQLQDFCKQRREFVARVLQEGEIFIEWRARSSKERSDDIHEQKKARYTAICQKFQDLGYEECDIQKIKYEKSVDVAKKLTHQGWMRIRAGLEEIIIKEKDGRLEFERQKRMAERLCTFKKVFDDHSLTVLPSLWLQYPHWREVATFPKFNEIIDSPDNIIVDEESFAPALADLPSLIARWLEDKRAALKKQLVATNVHVPSIVIHSSADMTDVLDLATSIFQCAGKECIHRTPVYAEVLSDPLFGWIDAASHLCSDYTSGTSDLFSFVLFATKLPSYTKTVIVPFTGASVVAARLVRLAGLDPRRATIADMDRSGYYFFCSGCPATRFKRKAYPWRAAVRIFQPFYTFIERD
ncbi:hypothetical protein C0995_004108 [Termitomyces sp. Mi166|nr:hypothetical protein C0995_004108 [Termitomyces sp. Mi166\